MIVELVKDTSVGKTGDDEKNIFSEKWRSISFCKDLAKAAPKLCNFQACLQNSLSPRNPSPKVQTPMTDVAPGYASVMRLNGVISVN